MSKTRSFLLRLDRTLTQGLGRQLLLLGLLMLAAFGLAHMLLLLSPTDWGQFCEDKGISRWIAPLYLLIDANAFTSVYEGSASHWTEFLACIIYVIGIFLFTGMMVSVMTNVIERRVEKHRYGLIHYLKEGHYIIIGYDETIMSFVDRIFSKDPEAFILIMTSKSSVEVREILLKKFTEKQLKRVIVNYGHRTSIEAYKAIHIEAAKEVFIVGYHGQSAHDAINVECVDTICRYLSDPKITTYPKAITCVFKDLDTYSSFKSTEIFTDISKFGIEFMPYNYNAGWARQVLAGRYYVDRNGKRWEYPPVYKKGIMEEDKHYVHLVFVGTTNVAVATSIEAAHILHFPNFIKHPEYKTLITFIDVNADKEKEEFITRNRHFFEVQPYLYSDLTQADSGCDCQVQTCEERVVKEPDSTPGAGYDFLDVQFEFIKGDIYSKQVQDLLADWAQDGDNQYLSVFLALADQRTNFVMSMNMPDAIYDNDIPVFIRQIRSDNFVTNLRKASEAKGKQIYYTIHDDKLDDSQKRSRRYSNLFPFGMNDSVFYSEDIYLKRAKLINYLYDTADYTSHRFKGVLALDAIPNEQIWAEADSKWKKLTVALQWSNIYNAYTIDTKRDILRAVRGLEMSDDSQDFWTLSDDEVKMLAVVEHNRWNVEKLMMGFRKPRSFEDAYLAKEKFDDDAKKLMEQNKKLHLIHHDIRPFGELDDVKEMDFEFSRYIPWVLRMTS